MELIIERTENAPEADFDSVIESAAAGALREEGVTDDSSIEIKCANAASLEGREAVVGYQVSSMQAGSGGSQNPFMPKFPKRGTKGTAPEPKKAK